MTKQVDPTTLSGQLRVCGTLSFTVEECRDTRIADVPVERKAAVHNTCPFARMGDIAQITTVLQENKNPMRFSRLFQALQARGSFISRPQLIGYLVSNGGRFERNGRYWRLRDKTHWEHNEQFELFEVERTQRPKEPPAATHTGKRLRVRGKCAKCSTPTNWVTLSGSDSYWCGCD